MNPTLSCKTRSTSLATSNPKLRSTMWGAGVITLTNSELFYEGTIAEEKVVKYFKLDQLTQLPFAPASHFEVPDYDASFKFVPTDNIKGGNGMGYCNRYYARRASRKQITRKGCHERNYQNNRNRNDYRL
jgi:hypothetical protein